MNREERVARWLRRFGRVPAGLGAARGEQVIGPDALLVQDYVAQLERLPPSARVREQARRAEAEAEARAAPLKAHADLLQAAWSTAIASLPGAVRQAVEQAFAALAEAENQMASTQRRLADLPSGDATVWIEQRSRLETAADQLHDLIMERRRSAILLCRSVARALDSQLAARAAEADQATRAAEREYAEVQARHRAAIGRLAATARALGAVRAAAMSDPRAVEQAIGGRALSPDEAEQARAARRQAREAAQRIALLLKGGRSE